MQLPVLSFEIKSVDGSFSSDWLGSLAQKVLLPLVREVLRHEEPAGGTRYNLKAEAARSEWEGMELLT